MKTKTPAPKASAASKSANTVTITVPAVIVRELAKHRVTPKRFLKDIVSAVSGDDAIGHAISDIYRRDKPGWISGLFIVQGE